MHAMSLHRGSSLEEISRQPSAAMTTGPPFSFYETLDQVLADQNNGRESCPDELTMLKGLTIRTRPSIQPAEAL